MKSLEWSSFLKAKAREKLSMLMENGLEYGRFMRHEKYAGRNRENGRKPWVIHTLAEALRDEYCSIYRRKDNHKIPVSNFTRNIEGWLRDDGPVISEKFWIPLANVFFSDVLDWERYRVAFLESLQSAWDNRHAVDDDDLYGQQILTDAQLRAVYAFDDYCEEGRNEVKNIDLDLFRAWHDAYSTGFLYHCPSKKSEIAAVTGFFPVPDTWADAFLARSVDEHRLLGKMIRNAHGARPSLTWYYSGLSAKAAAKMRGLRSYLPKIVGYSLLVWAQREAHFIGRQRIRIVSEGTTDIGERILARWFKIPAAGRLAAAEEDRPRFEAFVTLDQIKNLLLTDRRFPDTDEFRSKVRAAFPK